MMQAPFSGRLKLTDFAKHLFITKGASADTPFAVAGEGQLGFAMVRVAFDTIRIERDPEDDAMLRFVYIWKEHEIATANTPLPDFKKGETLTIGNLGGDHLRFDIG